MNDWVDTHAVTWLYIAARVFGSCCLLPFWETSVFLFTRITLTVLCLPAYALHAQIPVSFNSVSLAVEVVLGVLLVLPVVLFLELVAGLGELFDTIRGQTIATQYTGVGDSPDGVSAFIARSLLWTVLLLAGGFEHILTGLSLSFQQIPPGTFSFSYLINNAPGVLKIVVYECTAVLHSFLPVAVLLLLIELSCAALQTILPGVSLQSECFIAKTVWGVLYFFVLITTGVLTISMDWLEVLGSSLRQGIQI